MSELVYFDDKNSDYKKIIRKQGDLICRGKIYQEIINNALSKFTIGFANVIEKAQAGKMRKSRSDRTQITSFCLLFEIPPSFPTYKELHIILICGMQTKNGEATELLHYVMEYAKQNKYNRLSLHSLDEKKLLDWYLEHGFKIVDTIYEGSEIKAIKLAIDLRYAKVPEPSE